MGSGRICRQKRVMVFGECLCAEVLKYSRVLPFYSPSLIMINATSMYLVSSRHRQVIQKEGIDYERVI